VQLAAALILVAIAVLLALNRWWPFNTSPPDLPQNKPTFWQFLLSDHLTLGFVRLGVVMLAVFVIASVPALITGGRWLKASGLPVSRPMTPPTRMKRSRRRMLSSTRPRVSSRK
jgi:hypothetical protein